MNRTGTRGSVQYRLAPSHRDRTSLLMVKFEDLYWTSYVRGPITDKYMLKLVDEGKRAISDKIREKLCA